MQILPGRVANRGSEIVSADESAAFGFWRNLRFPQDIGSVPRERSFFILRENGLARGLR
jgi:hypothetical protein